MEAEANKQTTGPSGAVFEILTEDNKASSLRDDKNDRQWGEGSPGQQEASSPQ